MATTTISTESARPSLVQNLEDIYAKLHAGGAYDAKDLTTDGEHNEAVTSLQSRTQTPKGFKTKMLEGQTEFKMVTDNKITTRMLESVNGAHSRQKYWKM